MRKMGRTSTTGERSYKMRCLCYRCTGLIVSEVWKEDNESFLQVRCLNCGMITSVAHRRNRMRGEAERRKSIGN